ncbi:proteasome activator Blm10p [Trichomonascus vanleenenianus]|uniref:proteasome activator BLM10 n=1 Tax=Trichomonascus vanleenenianus TaxID=2268995 RepID=UPI003EC9586C
MRDETYRSRERTFPYQSVLPYSTESDAERQAHLDHIIANLYAAIEGHDLKAVFGVSSAGAGISHWTRELRSWLELKFDMPLSKRIVLARFYYALALSGIETHAMDKCVSMFMYLAKDEQFQDSVKADDLQLDWRLLVREIKKLSLYTNSTCYDGNVAKTFSLLSRLAQVARTFFDPNATLSILREIIPSFTPAKASISHNILSLLVIILPVMPVDPPPEGIELPPQDLLPSVFHLWRLQVRSSLYDFQSLDLVSSIVGDSLASPLVPFSKYGLLTNEQLSFTFTAILRLLEVPVSYAGSPYVSSSETVNLSDKDHTNRCGRPIATLVIYSLIGDKSLEEEGIMDRLDHLMTAVETFCHPSNYGPWTKNIISTVHNLVELFQLRWNIQQAGESVLPKERFLTDRVKDRFVTILRNVTFMGLYSKSSSVVSTATEALHGLALLAPDLIVPRFLKQVYPSLQGLVETHRTASSLKALVRLTRVIAKSPRYAFHLTTLLSLAIPGIDANDLSKTLQTLGFIQAAALSIPFHDLSEQVGPGLAMDYVSQDVAHLEEDDFDKPLPLVEDPELLDNIIKSSTAAFGEFIALFLGRVFTMLENLPDQTSKSRDSPESQVVATLPPTLTAVFASVSPDLYDRVLTHVVDFLANNVVSSATDAVAHMCGCLVKVQPQMAFSRLFPVIKVGIEQQIEDIGAGSTRSWGSEIMPRDRGLVWYLSALNMSLAHVGADIMPFKSELLDLTLYLRARCQGVIVYHVSNTVHHALMTLTSVFIQDFTVIPPGEAASTAHWGRHYDPRSELKDLKWHVPSRAEVEFAYEMYKKHCELSISTIRRVAAKKSGEKAPVTQISDLLATELTYLRTSTSGMALLFDPDYSYQPKAPPPSLKSRLTAFDEFSAPSPASLEQSIEDEESDSDSGGGITLSLGGDDDEEVYIDINLLINGDEDDDENDAMELKKLRDYPTGYFFGKNKTDPLYQELHVLRTNVGKALHEIHNLVYKSHESDISSYKALMFAFKVWFSDVGLERSSRIVESTTQLYLFETKPYRVPGLRKDYPRPILAKRAQVYHCERLQHASGPRKMTDLESLLLSDVARSAMSIYPDIRRNAYSALDSALRVLIRSRRVILPWVIKETASAIEASEYKRAESGFRTLHMRSLSATLRRDHRNIVALVKTLHAAMLADYESLNMVAAVLYQVIALAVRLPLNVVEISDSVLDLIRPAEVTSEMKQRIDKARQTKQTRRQEAIDQLKELTNTLLATDPHTMHWKLEAGITGLLINISASPQFDVDPRVFVRLIRLAHAPQTEIRSLAISGLSKLGSTVYNRAQFDYNYLRFSLPYDEEHDLPKDQFELDCTTPGFTELFLKEISNDKTPEYFVASVRAGWLVWPQRLPVERVVESPTPIKFGSSDETAFAALGGNVTKEWFTRYLSLHQEEMRVEEGEEETFDPSNFVFLRYLLRLIDLGFCAISVEEFLEVIETSFNPQDKNSHRSTAEACTAIAKSMGTTPEPLKSKKRDMLTRLFRRVVTEQLAHDNIEYWQSFVMWPASTAEDYRRYRNVTLVLAETRVEGGSADSADSTEEPKANGKRRYPRTVFEQSSRMSLLRKEVGAVGWYYRDAGEDMLTNLWQHIDHPLQGVRDEIAKTLAVIYKTRFIEAYPSIEKFVESNKASVSTLGDATYALSPELASYVKDAFTRLEQWRLKRDAEEPESNEDAPKKKKQTDQYVHAAQTLGVWLERVLKTSYSTALVPLLPTVIIPALAHFLNVREEQEVMMFGVTAFRLLGNVAYPLEGIQSMIDTIVATALNTQTSWHQRISLLSLIQAFFFRQLFMMTNAQRSQLIDATVAMTEDSQLEVRTLAAETLAGLIRCSASKQQHILVTSLTERFFKILKDTAPSSKRKRGQAVDQQQLVKRHAAVLGLGSLVSAFPYASPPPVWIPNVLATLATRAASDPGMIGRSVKSSLSDFKKTRQDTWHIDVKVFTQEQLEDLEGVLWKNYFV